MNTYTTLVKPNQRWGTNGGDDKWQHDIYNSGMLMEAAVHYYKASGKTKLLNVAVKLTNFICKEIGPAPKLNVIPGHGGPEEALLKFYQLFKDEPALKNKISAPVKEDDYLKMVKFWIEQRGNYGNIDGTHKRNSDSSYNQDHKPVLLQKTIEGHAVRATLLATGVTATALETKDKRYRNTANNYWNNMIGKRMFITGGEGAIANGERFGEDFYLPESAYLETCAAIGAGFFSEQMNELEADGKYMDEFERILYNNMLSGVSLGGDQYFYENPLIGNGHKRWTWHGCPCCPPMFLKMIGSLPQYIYGQNNANVFVNLFIGSQAILNISNTEVTLNQTGTYPWNGNIKIEVSPKVSKNFTVNLRIPGWAMQKENPFDLYRSKVNGKAVLKINGKLVSIQAENGYAIVNRLWKKGDIIDLILPMSPRIIEANEAVNAIKGKVALASGPIVYCLESVDNPNQKEFIFNASEPLKLAYTNILYGINTITGLATDNKGKKNKFMAIPFYAVGNRELGAYYQVWLTQNH